MIFYPAKPWLISCKLSLYSSQIQNKYLVEGMDVVIRYGLYNVGDSVASDIVLTEAGFGTDDFDIAGKMYKK